MFDITNSIIIYFKFKLFYAVFNLKLGSLEFLTIHQCCEYPIGYPDQDQKWWPLDKVETGN